jgi:hypothetical protein
VARRILACSTAVALATTGESARADARCAEVQQAAGLSGAWADAARELQRQLDRIPTAECQTATLQVEPFEGGARIIAVKADGRRAERMLKRPESVVAVGLGLVMAVPELEANAPPAAATPPTSPPPTPSASATVPAAPPVPAVRPRPAAPSTIATPVALGLPLELWLGFEVGGRTAIPATVAAADVATHADILINHWLFQIMIRDSPVGFSPGQGFDNDAYREVNVGLGFGRRYTSGDTSFDVLLSPAIAAMRLEWDFAPGREAEGEDVEFALDASVRVALALSRSWALTLTLESELVPGNLTSSSAHVEPPSNLPSTVAAPPNFPGWMGGVRFGAMGAVL